MKILGPYPNPATCKKAPERAIHSLMKNTYGRKLFEKLTLGP
jgi:hypothetical protein